MDSWYVVIITTVAKKIMQQLLFVKHCSQHFISTNYFTQIYQESIMFIIPIYRWHRDSKYFAVTQVIKPGFKPRHLGSGIWTSHYSLLSLQIFSKYMWVFWLFLFFIFKYILLIMLLQLSYFPPSLHSILHTPSLPHSPPIVHVHGSYI